MSKGKALTPIRATTGAQICSLPFDNVDLSRRKAWILLEVKTISFGIPEMSHLTLTRQEFEAAIDWYQKGTIPKAEKRKGSKAI